MLALWDQYLNWLSLYVLHSAVRKRNRNAHQIFIGPAHDKTLLKRKLQTFAGAVVNKPNKREFTLATNSLSFHLFLRLHRELKKYNKHLEVKSFLSNGQQEMWNFD